MGLDFSLQWHQEELRRTARDFLARSATLEALRDAERRPEGFSPDTHQQIADLGWLEIGLRAGTPLREPGDAIDLIVLYEELGRAALPGPHFVCQLAGRILLYLDPDDERRLISGILQGSQIGTVALYEPTGNMLPVSTSADEDEHGYRLTGSKSYVPYASAADVILVLARTADGAVDFFAVPTGADGLSVSGLRSFSGERLHRIDLQGVLVDADARLGPPGSGSAALDAALPGTYIAHAAELVGLADAALEMSVQYAKDRVAFGHPIGSYQAISHKCADMVADRDAARYLTYQAACLCDQGEPGDLRVAMAKAFAAGAARRVTKEAHQIFAGAGYVLDHRMNHYYRRAKGIEMTLEDANTLLDLVADNMLGRLVELG